MNAATAGEPIAAFYDWHVNRSTPNTKVTNSIEHLARKRERCRVENAVYSGCAPSLDTLLNFQTKPATNPTNATTRIEPEPTEAAPIPPLPVYRDMRKSSSTGTMRTASTQITDAT